MKICVAYLIRPVHLSVSVEEEGVFLYTTNFIL